MLSFKKLNDLLGWIVFVVALVVYTLTVEQTASFWDCGEFIAVSYKLMVPHPPGAPFFLLIGRMFSFLAMGDVTQVAYWINMISVLASAFTILFLFWSITFIGKKMLGKSDEDLAFGEQILLLGASSVGALAYTFSDSFWFSAVEAEVYGMSSFFTAFVVWAMLKWENIKDARFENQWLLLIAYMVGLSIGVHLLNLVTIPALALIYYYKKYKHSWLNMGLALFGGLVVVGIINSFIIPGLPTIAGKFEVLFVNDLGLPFGSGALVFVLLFLGSVAYGVIYSEKKQNALLNTAMLSLVMILIGYSSYALVLIRSNYNPPIDENDPENVMSFVSYLKREQYGDRPLLYGRTFMSRRAEDGIVQGDPIYTKGKDKYEIVDYKTEVKYEDNVLLPRMYSNSGNHPQLYMEWSGLKEGQKPTLLHNLKYMFRYQIGHMYFRYFMWNFAGRDGDEKEATWLSPLSPSKDLPESIATNKARDNFYMLPLILGIIGLIFQFSRDDKGFTFVAMLFVLTGVAIVVYLNSPPVEPRERDYIYVGSFYAFAIWIGLGVIGIADMLKKVLKNQNMQAIAASLLCLFVPLLMGFKGWDNHNRQGRFHSIDQAKNTLRSCAPNAVLFTGGDNDTFPLWYVQDVEGFRTDVRVVVLSYFSTDWYINQMKREVYESKPLPISLEYEQYKAGKNEFLPFIKDQAVDKPINVATFMKLIKEENPNIQVPLQGGGTTSLLPSKSFFLPVDSAAVIKKGFIPKGKENRVVKNMLFSLEEGQTAIYKSDLMILDMLATFGWDRPIYFNNTSANTTMINLRDYLHIEGMAYRLLPIKTQIPDVEEVNLEVMAKNMESFEFRGFENPNAYHDDEYRKFGANLRSLYLRLAREYLQKGDKAQALKSLETSLKNIPDASIPYDYYAPQYVELFHQLGEHDKAKNLAQIIGKRSEENLAFLDKNRLNSFNYRYLRDKSYMTLNQLLMVYRRLEERESRNSILELDQEMPKDSTASPMLKYYRDSYKRYENLFSQYYKERE